MDTDVEDITRGLIWKPTLVYKPKEIYKEQGTKINRYVKKYQNKHLQPKS